MSWLIPLLFAGAIAPVMLPADEPLRADRLVAHAGLRSLLQASDADPRLQLAIGHAGGEAGTARAEALRAALVALGLSSARITLAPQPLDEPILIISLEKATP
jgi:hypothetical protein